MAKHRKSNIYRLLHFWIGAGLRTFWKIEVNGRENLPWGKPFIVMPNHENALIDAVIVITQMPDQPYSIARAGAFQNPFVARLLKRIRMFPIYRPQDGVENMSKNEQIMQDIVDCMKEGQRILIYPEGDQNMSRRLRPLKKGTFRMAMMALNQMDGDLDLQMVPTGLTYEAHAKMGRHCVLNFGEPVSVREIWEANERHDAKTIKELLPVISDRMRELMMNIPSAEFNTTIEHLREMYVTGALKDAGIKTKRYTDRLRYDQEFANTFVEQEVARKEEFTALKEKVQGFEHRMRDLKLRQGLFARKNWPLHELLGEAILYLLSFPLFLLGFAINILPYKMGQRFAYKIFKSKNFEGTGLFFLGLVTHTLWWTVWALVIGLSSTWWLGIYFYFFAHAMGSFAFVYAGRIRKWAAKWRFRAKYARHRKLMQGLYETRQEIIQTAKTIWTPSV
jgi:1-acyl-sn-glycerol-3-phosphate acyltransferase